MPLSWSGRSTQTLSAAALSAVLLAGAAKHFSSPAVFGQLVPDALCRDDSGERTNATLAVFSREEWVAVSGLLEAAAAVGLLIPATRRFTATGTAMMFAAFLAGHVEAVREAYGPDGTPGRRRAHTVRLPLQLPLILWAWSLRGIKPAPGTGPGR